MDLASRTTIVELVDLLVILRNRPDYLVALAIDIPIGLLDGPRACDRAAPYGVAACSRHRVVPPCWPEATAKHAIPTTQEPDVRSVFRPGVFLQRSRWHDAISPSTQEWILEVRLPLDHDLRYNRVTWVLGPLVSETAGFVLPPMSSFVPDLRSLNK